MTDLLQEFCDSRGLALRVDRQAGLIRGIKILGTRSRNRRDYLPDALARAVGLYEGAKVNVNHPKGQRSFKIVPAPCGDDKFVCGLV